MGHLFNIGSTRKKSGHVYQGNHFSSWRSPSTMTKSPLWRWAENWCVVCNTLQNGALPVGFPLKQTKQTGTIQKSADPSVVLGNPTFCMQNEANREPIKTQAGTPRLCGSSSRTTIWGTGQPRDTAVSKKGFPVKQPAKGYPQNRHPGHFRLFLNAPLQILVEPKRVRSPQKKILNQSVRGFQSEGVWNRIQPCLLLLCGLPE